MAFGEGPYDSGWTYKGTPYTVTLEIREVLGQLEPVAISVRPKARGELRPLPPLRAIPVPELFNDALTTIQALVNSALRDQHPVGNDAEMDDTFRAKRKQFWEQQKIEALGARDVLQATGERHGRRWGPDHNQDVLDACAHADAIGHPQKEVVAEFFVLTPETAAKHITRAKKWAEKQGRQIGPPGRRASARKGQR